jgi:hypothetical protein
MDFSEAESAVHRRVERDDGDADVIELEAVMIRVGSVYSFQFQFSSRSRPLLQPKLKTTTG